MPFLSPLDTRAYHPGEFVLLERFGYEFDLADRRYRLCVPRGFITDFASIPWAVQRLPGFDVNGASRPAAIPHDWIYCNQGRVRVELVEPQSGVIVDDVLASFTRRQADEILRMAILDVGGDKYTRDMVKQRYTRAQAAMFKAGVQLGGWYYWRQRRHGLVPDFDMAPAGFLEASKCAY